MISVVVEADEDEAALAEALSALIPAVAEGVVREAIIADPHSRPGVRTIADALGCAIVHGPPERAVDMARSDWVLALAPRLRLEEGWHHEAKAFMERAERMARPGVAAAFSPAVARAGLGARLRALKARFARRRGALLAPRGALAAGEKLRIERLRARAFERS